MPLTSALLVLLLLSMGAFILPVLVIAHVRGTAGILFGAIALIILLGFLADSDERTAATHADLANRPVSVHPVAHEPGAAAAERAAGIPLDAAQFERERAEIEREWQAAELQRRLWHAGSLAGMAFIWLALATAYLKLDLLTAGKYRGRLRIGAAAATLLGTLASAWAWTMPL